MKIKSVIIFILIIFLIIVAFVGLPYFFVKLKSIDFNFTNLFSATSSSSFLNYKRIWSSSPVSSPSSNSTVSTIRTGESIYKGKVRISGIRRSNPEEIDLNAAFSGSSSSINISGWRVKSTERGIETVIGKGLALPQFNSFLSDIRLKSGESVKIVAGISPLVSNFQINSCFGWLNNIYNLGSSFNYCPAIQLSDLAGSGLDSACKELILRYGSCQTLSNAVLNSSSGECRIWIEKNLNYSACVQKHLNESNFYKGWRIYTGNSNLMFDLLHDKVELRDQAGLLIDSYEY